VHRPGINYFRVLHEDNDFGALDRLRIERIAIQWIYFHKKLHWKKTKQFFKDLHKKFSELLPKWRDFKPLRGRIEDVFKLIKDGFFREKIHRYTRKSCYKFVLMGVLLAGVIINEGFHSQKLKMIDNGYKESTTCYRTCSNHI